MVRDAEVCDDLTQNVFYKAMRYKHSYRGGKFVSWLFKIARNLLADYWQEKKKQYQFDAVEDLHLAETSSNKQEIQDYVMALLHKLPEADRELLVLHKLQGIQYEDLAEIMGSTAGALKVKTHRILKKMKTELGDTMMV